MAEFKLFNESDIRKKVPMSKAIELMKEAFTQLSSGTADVPMRSSINTQDHSGSILFMPSYSPPFNLFGLKMVSVFKGNASKDFPVIQGKMIVMDGQTGTPLALLDAGYLTALRTGAASGLATEILGRKDARVLAVFGTGAQAETQVIGMMSVRDIQEILVFGRTEKNSIAFCERVRRDYPVEIRQARSLADLKQADIICTATTSLTPLFELKHIKNGTHINAVGSFKNTMQEIPSEVIQQSRLIVDQREAALSEAGDIVIPIQYGLIDQNHIAAELGELVTGAYEGRTSDDQVTVFKSVGNAIQDLTIAHYITKN